MYFVYVLFSILDGKLYIGYSSELDVRIESHVSGKVASTKNRRPLKLIYYEAYLTAQEAKRREKYLKGGSGRKELKKQLKDTLEDLGYRHR